MPPTVTDLGTDNQLDVDPDVFEGFAGAIVFKGSRARVRIEGPFVAHAISIELGDDCSITVGPHCHVGILIVYMATGGTIAIGAGASFNGQTRLLLHEPGRIDIGAGCLFGPDVDVTVSDMHALIDLETGQRVNPARDVTVGARVWLGIGTFVGKGARIGEGAVVGARTFVTGEVRSNTVVAGNPPRLLRENVSWRFSL
ncbi:acyltransferase [Methylobacterium sp. J-067]|uniref:acyltransferase n=1 Tax=Methylobacterium sp. J-067 TaxID=2836648 RepID=UPI001FBA4FEF|nr:hypothetical protein [Methylobacterium sp. J-067]MCJ2023603.1 hypothetical protein [Methylobacterium sp. J-067]